MKKYISLILLSWFVHSQLFGQQDLDFHKAAMEEDEEEYYDDINGRAENEAILHGQLPGKEFNYSRARWDAYLELQQKKNNAKVENINGNWSFIGPYGISPGLKGIGRVDAIEVISNSEWLVGTAQGGLWKTTDAGSTWSCLTDGLPNLAITDVDVDPNNSDVIYILTGDRDASQGSLVGPPGIGILKSTDGGSTWLSTGMFFDRDEQYFGDRIEVDPNSPNRIWATIKDSIFVSENGGLSFTQSAPTNGFRDLELMPGNPDFVLASKTNSVWYRESPDSNWVESSGLEDVENMQRLLIAYAPSNPYKVYAMFAGTGTSYRIYSSFDGGKSFTVFHADTIHVFSKQVFYNMVLIVDPDDETTVYAGGVFLWKSTNSGGDWTQFSCQTCDDLPYAHPDYHALEYTPDGVLLMGNDGGIYRTFEDTILDASDGLYTTQLYHITTLSSDTSIIGAGAQDNGALLKKADQTNFQNLKQSDGQETYFVDSTNVFFSEGEQGKLWFHLYNNGGVNIRPDTGAWDTPLIQDPVDPGTLFMCFDSIYKFQYTNALFTYKIAASPLGTDIREAEIGISNHNTFYIFERLKVGDEYVGFLDRSDNIQNWNPTFKWVYSSEDFYSLTDIVVDPTDSWRIWVTIGGYDEGSKVYYSNDGGKYFENVSGSLPNVPAYCITYVPGSDDGLYVGTDVGVFYKDNSLGDWIPFQNGLPVVSVREIEVLPNYGVVRAATLGRGIWQSEMFTGECQDTINLVEGEYDQGFNVVQVTSLITSVAILDQGIGTDVTYDAGDAIYLNEGFEVKSSGVFTAKIDGCQSLVSKYAALTGTYAGPMTGFQSDPIAIKQSSIDVSLFPNPAHKEVAVEFTLESESKVSIYVLDELGRVIYCLADGEKYMEGNHRIRFDTSNLPANMYSIHLLSSSGQGFAKLNVVH